MNKTVRAKKHVERRKKHQEKKQTLKFKLFRKKRIKLWLNGERFTQLNPKVYLPPVEITAPSDLKFIDNTDDVISYIEYGRKILQTQSAIKFDISKIKSLSPDAITILIAHIKSFQIFNIPVFGNAPDDLNMRKMFTESGFYNYVRSKKKYATSDGNLMHKESNFKVKPDIAGKAIDLILQNGQYDTDQVEAIYNIFIEMMSNTHHHASLKSYGQSKWWLYVYNDKDRGVTSVCFLDLGVGIFKSIVVRNYLKRIGLKLSLAKSISLVDDLISGKIGSRIDIDNEIRGKGIPQIMEYSKLEVFKDFHLITNDVKINLKRNEKTQLANSFSGTFYHFELSSKKNENGTY